MANAAAFKFYGTKVSLPSSRPWSRARVRPREGIGSRGSVGSVKGSVREPLVCVASDKTGAVARSGSE